MCDKYKNLTLISIVIPTNIGYAIKKEPNIVNQINELVIMGVGSYLNQNYKNKFIFSKWERLGKWNNNKSTIWITKKW